MQNFGNVPTMGEKNVYDGLYVSKSASMDRENKTLYILPVNNLLTKHTAPFGVIPIKPLNVVCYF